MSFDSFSSHLSRCSWYCNFKWETCYKRVDSKWRCLIRFCIFLLSFLWH